MGDTAGYILHVGMTTLLVYTSNKLCFEFKQMPLRAGIFLILTPQKFRKKSKNCFLDQCVQAYTSASALSYLFGKASLE